MELANNTLNAFYAMLRYIIIRECVNSYSHGSVPGALLKCVTIVHLSA
jgi:hypothetical protein